VNYHGCHGGSWVAQNPDQDIDISRYECRIVQVVGFVIKDYLLDHDEHVDTQRVDNTTWESLCPFDSSPSAPAESHNGLDRKPESTAAGYGSRHGIRERADAGARDWNWNWNWQAGHGKPDMASR
jgi:hypothetical protein